MSESSTTEKQTRTSRSARAGLTFPVGRVHRYLRRGTYARRIGSKAPIYLAAVLEFLTTELTTMGGNTAKDVGKRRVHPRHLLLGLLKDEQMKKLVTGVYCIKKEKKRAGT